MQKICSTCQAPHDAPSCYCRPCKRKYDRAYRAKHKTKLDLERKKRRLEREYGITIEDYETMAEAQGGLCALCHQVPGPTNRYGPGLVVDHDHVSGNVRALLCHSCNVALGHFQDDSARLRRAIDYLERHRG